MTYFPALRRQYILWRLADRGELRRGDIVRTFGIDMSSASGDINALLADVPGEIEYDKSRKLYVPAHPHAPEAGLVRIAKALGWD